MIKDEYIALMERNIKLLQQKINVLDDINMSCQDMTAPVFKTHKSLLPFEINDFMQNNSKKIIKGLLSKGYHEDKTRRIIPMPGLESSFCYDFLKNECWSKGPMHLIWGWKDQCNGNFEEVVKMVININKQRFKDLIFDSIGKESNVITGPILIKNGNQIAVEYNFLYHAGDFEHRSPLLLQGRTRLIRINAH